MIAKQGCRTSWALVVSALLCLASDRVCAGSTGELFLQVQPNAELKLSPPARFGPLASPQAALELATSTPAICNSFATAGTTLRLLDSNLELQLLPGVAAVWYGPAPEAMRLIPVQGEHGPQLQCRAIPEAGSGTSVNPDRVLRAGFERIADTVVGASGLGGEPITVVEHTPGGQAMWRVRFANQGEVATGMVRVREYLPNADGLHSPAVTAIACQLDGQPCSTDAVGRVSLVLGPMAPGESRELELTRSVASTEAGVSAIAAIAVFADPDVAPERSPAGGVVAVELRVIQAE